MVKNNQRVFNKYFIILILGTILWFAETAYFGFNKTPENGLEGALDILSLMMIVYGFIGDLMRNVRITKHYHNITTNRINTKNVEVTGSNQKITQNSTIKMSPESIKQLSLKPKSNAK